MKATGIVRKVDDLGRIVIPKEIRNSLRISEGDPLELFTENGLLIVKKYWEDAPLATVLTGLINELNKRANNEEAISHLSTALTLLKGEENE